MADINLNTDDLWFFSGWFKDIHDEIQRIQWDLDNNQAFGQFNQSLDIAFQAHDKLRMIADRFERDERILVSKDPCNYVPSTPFQFLDHTQFMLDDFYYWLDNNPGVKIAIKILPVYKIPKAIVNVLTGDIFDVLTFPVDVVDSVLSGLVDSFDLLTGNDFQDRDLLKDGIMAGGEAWDNFQADQDWEQGWNGHQAAEDFIDIYDAINDPYGTLGEFGIDWAYKHVRKFGIE